MLRPCPPCSHGCSYQRAQKSVDDADEDELEERVVLLSRLQTERIAAENEREEAELAESGGATSGASELTKIRRRRQSEQPAEPLRGISAKSADGKPNEKRRDELRLRVRELDPQLDLNQRFAKMQMPPVRDPFRNLLLCLPAFPLSSASTRTAA
eukprot:SAG11_NODE_1605_length_4593_cov_2.083667_3_plen_155_part_00